MKGLPLVLSVVLAGAPGCGGEGDGGERLLSGSLSGEYDGDGFTVEFGFATVYHQNPLIALGDGPLRCGSEADDDPPSGTNAAISLPAFETGEYASVLVLLYHNVDDFESSGANVGSLSITAVSDESIAGALEYDYTDDQDRHFAISGTFDVVRCAP